jgi:hypothetical protein
MYYKRLDNDFPHSDALLRLKNSIIETRAKLYPPQKNLRIPREMVLTYKSTNPVEPNRGTSLTSWLRML